MASAGSIPPRTSTTSPKLYFIERCRLLENAQRHDDMVSLVTAFIKTTNTELTTDERNLFSIAFKNVMGPKRTSFRILRAVEALEISEAAAEPNLQRLQTIGANLPSSRKLQLAREYRDKIKAEICSVSNEVIHLLDTKLVPMTKDVESKVFYAKMKADYHRYLAEVAEREHRGEAIDLAQKLYAEALELSKRTMKSTHPIGLGLVLNYSVFFYEIMADKDKAETLAKTTFDNAISELDTLSDTSFKDTTIVLQLLRDNLGHWASEVRYPSATGSGQADANGSGQAHAYGSGQADASGTTTGATTGEAVDGGSKDAS